MSKPRKFTRIFFATDIHGSERCFRKFIAGARFYEADVLVLGGDITGKFVIPIVDEGNGVYSADYLGTQETVKTPEELKHLEERAADSGYYCYHCTESEMQELKQSEEKVDKLFLKLMTETLGRWIELAEPVLRETNTMCYVTGGNDDRQEVLDAIKETEHVKKPDNQIVKIDETHEMANIGWSNPTPWKCPRECSEEELHARIEALLGGRNCEKVVFNFHAPPVDCGLDTVPKLDESVYPPKPVLQRGSPVLIGAGSKSVRDAVEKYQPVLDLCGHVHESRGVCKIAKTLVVNPGSEYSEGILRGVMVNLSDKKILSWQLTSG